MKVFLIHGMGRTQVSMALLARRLAKAGHDVSCFGYFVARDPLDVIAHKLTGHIGDAEDYAIVGHSLGNVIARLASPRLPRLKRLMMLAPPNAPPVLARALEKNPVYRALTKDAGRKLLDDAFYASLPVPQVPILVVAGNRGPRQRWLPFRGAPSDGIVSVEETRLPGVPHVEVPAVHTFIMNDAEVARLALRFLADDVSFRSGAREPANSR